jgi:hypothetical protein
LLTKSELLDRVWPGLVVEEANLQMQISNLRKLLGGEAIATVPGAATASRQWWAARRRHLHLPLHRCPHRRRPRPRRRAWRHIG